MALAPIAREEFLAGSSFTVGNAYTFFALLLVGALMVWSAWGVYSCWRTMREDSSKGYGEFEFVSSVLQISILLTLVMLWVAF
jgi:hypothetical protein